MVKYTNEIIKSPDGVNCRVLDESNIDFSESLESRKKKETIVLKAIGNERIDTINSEGKIESTYNTNPGEAIFYNNENDIYVPRDGNGNAWLFEKKHLNMDMRLQKNHLTLKVILLLKLKA